MSTAIIEDEAASSLVRGRVLEVGRVLKSSGLSVDRQGPVGMVPGPLRGHCNVYVPIADLQTDQRYSPGIKETLVEQIDQEGWNPVAAYPIRVNQRPDGSYYILDGWSRVEAAQRQGETHLWVLVYHFETLRQEAYWSKRWNLKIAPLTPLETFRYGLQAGEPLAVDIAKIAKRQGFRITDDSISTLEKIYTVGGPDGLDEVLEIVGFSWEGEPESTAEDILKAVFVLIALYAEDLREDDLIFRFREHKASWWLREVEAERGDSPTYVKLAQRFLKAYNYYKHSGRGGKLPAFDVKEAISLFDIRPVVGY